MSQVVEVKKATKLNTKDMIYAGAFAALYVVAVLIIMTLFGTVPILYIACPLTLGVFCGAIYLLSVLKVRKFGAALVIALLFACIATGFDPIAFSVCVVAAVLAEICIALGKYRSRKMYVLSYVFFNFITASNFVRILVAKDAYINNVRSYVGDEFANGMNNLVTPWWSWLMIFGFAIAGGVIGGLLGSRLIKKHFEKAGIV